MKRQNDTLLIVAIIGFFLLVSTGLVVWFGGDREQIKGEKQMDGLVDRIEETTFVESKDIIGQVEIEAENIEEGKISGEYYLDSIVNQNGEVIMTYDELMDYFSGAIPPDNFTLQENGEVMRMITDYSITGVWERDENIVILTEGSWVDSENYVYRTGVYNYQNGSLTSLQSIKDLEDRLPSWMVDAIPNISRSYMKFKKHEKGLTQGKVAPDTQDVDNEDIDSLIQMMTQENMEYFEIDIVEEKTQYFDDYTRFTAYVSIPYSVDIEAYGRLISGENVEILGQEFEYITLNEAKKFENFNEVELEYFQQYDVIILDTHNDEYPRYMKVEKPKDGKRAYITELGYAYQTFAYMGEYNFNFPNTLSMYIIRYTDDENENINPYSPENCLTVDAYKQHIEEYKGYFPYEIYIDGLGNIIKMVERFVS